MPSEIRPATPDDRPALEAIVAAAYAPYVPQIGRRPGPMDDDYAARIRDRQAFVLVQDGVIEGVLVLVPETDAMLLDNIAVRPDAHGHGHGRTLLAFAEQAARAQGCRSIRLYTHIVMERNIALYGRSGYVETHRGESGGLHRVYMTKTLATRCT